MARDVGDSTVEDLDKRIQASREVRREFEGQWLLNIAYFVGNQWLRFDGTQLYAYEPEDEYEPLIVDNRIQPGVRTEVAKITKTQPTWVGVPRDDTDQELSAARMRERVFEHYWRVLKLRRRLRRALLWSRVGTAGFWKIPWDSQAGDLMTYMAAPDPATGQLKEVTLPDGRLLTPDRVEEANAAGIPLDPGLVEQQRYTGDVALHLKSPFEMFPDALAAEEGLETCEWIGEEGVYSRNQLWKMLGATEQARDLVLGLEETTKPTAGIAESRMPGAGFGTPRRGGAGYRGLRVREYWSLPGLDDPNGRHVIWIAGGQVLLEEHNPYPWLPYVMFAGTAVPGRFWPDCMTTQGIPLQTELNKHESQVASNAERVGNVGMRRSSDSLIEPEDEPQPIRPGEDLVYRETGGEPPDYLRPPELPAYVQNRREEIQQSLKEVFRQYEVSQGTVPAGVTAASAISLLQESGDTVLSPDIDDVADSLADAGRIVLGLVQKFATGERIARVAGEEGQWVIAKYRGDQLAKCDLDEVQIGSGVPDSRAAKQAAITNMLTLMLQQGVALNPRDIRRVLRDYEVAGLDHILATLNRDEEQIADENRRLLQGEGLDQPQPVFDTEGFPLIGPDGRTPLMAGIPVNPFDDDQLHIEGHENDLCKTSQWRELSQQPTGELIRQGVLAHIEMHKTRLAERAANMGMAQADGEDVGGAEQEPAAANGAQPQGAAA